MFPNFELGQARVHVFEVVRRETQLADVDVSTRDGHVDPVDISRELVATSEGGRSLYVASYDLAHELVPVHVRLVLDQFEDGGEHTRQRGQRAPTTSPLICRKPRGGSRGLQSFGLQEVEEGEVGGLFGVFAEVLGRRISHDASGFDRRVEARHDAVTRFCKFREGVR